MESFLKIKLFLASPSPNIAPWWCGVNKQTVMLRHTHKERSEPKDNRLCESVVELAAEDVNLLSPLQVMSSGCQLWLCCFISMKKLEQVQVTTCNSQYQINMCD